MHSYFYVHFNDISKNRKLKIIIKLKVKMGDSESNTADIY